MRVFLSLASLCLLLLTSGQIAAQSAAVRMDLGGPVRDGVIRLQGCTATLITPDTALSAAHCMPDFFRSVPPDPETCAKLPVQSQLAHHPGNDPMQWHEMRNRMRMFFGPDALGEDTPMIPVVSYSIPRCADMLMVKLAEPVSADIATPVPVVTRVSSQQDLERALVRGPLRHAGYGRASFIIWENAIRVTGRVAFWGTNECHLFALPPMRLTGKRIATGDSGAPLLLRLSDGREAVIGVLWGRSVLDHDVCGLPLPMPPADHGTYTPTFRGTIGDTDATDIAAWIETLAPEAAIKLP